MNDKDKEAFDKAWLDSTVEDYRGLGNGKTSIASIAVTSKRRAAEMLWQAACKYKQKEIEARKSELDYAARVLTDVQADKLEMRGTIQKLQAENAKLREVVKFYADAGSWEGREIDGDDWYDFFEDGNGIGGKRAFEFMRGKK